MIRLEQTTQGVRLAVKVVPGASRNRVVGELGGALKATVTAPPERGRANKLLAELLAETFHVRASQIRIESGAGSSRKTVLIAQTNLEHIRSALERLGIEA